MSRQRKVITSDGVEDIPFTPEEEAARDAEELIVVAGASARNILKQIKELEKIGTARRIRDAMHPGQRGQDGRDWLAALEAQIEALRAQL
jgi:hypothetical protein